MPRKHKSEFIGNALMMVAAVIGTLLIIEFVSPLGGVGETLFSIGELLRNITIAGAVLWVLMIAIIARWR